MKIMRANIKVIRPTMEITDPKTGSSALATERPICRSIISPADWMAKKIILQTNPIKKPKATSKIRAKIKATSPVGKKGEIGTTNHKIKDSQTIKAVLI